MRFLAELRVDSKKAAAEGQQAKEENAAVVCLYGGGPVKDDLL
jgi:hypothetical protein